ncbi:MAG: DNA-binding protein [Bacteroidales bacterium]|nr:DNA-binding protein [Bacteroidales bacterium]
MENTGEIVVYEPDEITRLEVHMKDETVWLTQTQMSALFGRDRTVITKHIRNIFTEQELDEKSNVHFLHFANSDKPVKIFSLDVIISVGYRVKSAQGTRFRQWANKVIKEYLLKGYCINPRITAIERRLDEHEKKIDFFVQSSLPPKQGIFFDGQIYDAYAFVADLVRSAKERIVLIDNYIDDTVLTMLSKRTAGVEAVIYTGKISKQLRLDIDKHNAQYPPVEVRTFEKAHDRFLIIDDKVYLVGASIKDLGKKWFGFTLMENTNAEELVGRI